MQTFAQHAEAGIYYRVTCKACRREVFMSARSLAASSRGDVPVVGSQDRFKCRGCHSKGVSFIISGQWTGPEWSKPADWAETVEERMYGLTEKF